MERLRVLLADDHPLVLHGVAALLSERFEIVGALFDGQTLVEMAFELKPAIVISDVSMPLISGFEAARLIYARLPETKFIFLSVHSNPIYVQRAFQVHASAYVLKSDAASELFTAIDHAMRGEIYLSPALGVDTIEQLHTSSGRPSRSPVELTARQRQILQFIAEGRQNKEIASQLNIGTKTVEFHRARLMNKLGIHSVGQLTRFAIEEGLIGASPELRGTGAASGL